MTSNVVQFHEEDFNAKTDISVYFHCKKCMNELPYEISPREYQRLQVGWTLHGLQVWCNRHDVNIIHINFEGQKHPTVLKRQHGQKCSRCEQPYSGIGTPLCPDCLARDDPGQKS